MFGANRTGDAATTLHKKQMLVPFVAEGESHSPSCLPLYPIFAGVVKGFLWSCPVDMHSIAHFCADVKGGRGDSGEIQGNFAGI